MTLDDLRLMRIEQVLRACGPSKSTLYKMMAQGKFPRPVRISDRIVGWRQSDIMAWLAERTLVSYVEDDA